MSNESIRAFRSLPEINFVNKDVQTMLSQMVAEYEEVYFESTGVRKTLSPGDPVRIWIYAQALREYGLLQQIDYAAKQNLLRYSEGSYLENLGAIVGEGRNGPSAAVTTVRFTKSQEGTTIPIPAGTLTTPGNGIFFETTVYAEIEEAEEYIDVQSICRTLGTAGNGFTPGQISTLVNPVAGIASVANTTTSQGGEAAEDDVSLRERIYLKPESFSVAGPGDAYVFFAKQYSSAIGDVKPSSPDPGVVDIRFILSDGSIPDSSLITEITNYLSASNRRPLTDNLQVGAPDQVDYAIELTYYIGKQNESRVVEIQDAINLAISEYVTWQKIRIGRDINPSELSARIVQAGAKRVEITSPVFTVIGETEVAKETTIDAAYGGLEDE